jgi:acyl-CoA synthetase (AMP-forming)/AMP-acid ligase II
VHPDITRARFAALEQPPELVAGWHREGLRSGAVVGPALFGRLAQFPANLAVVDGDRRLTNGAIVGLAEGLAGSLAAAGVGRGDVVSWQVPNWWEAVVVALAVWRLGAINNPVLMIYREHELRQILADMQPAAIVAPPAFRGHGHVEMLDSVLDEIGHDPALRVAVRGEAPGWANFEDLVEGQAPAPFPADLHPGDPCVVAYTSGTTAGAKGVVVDSYGVMAETRQMRETWGIAWDDVSFMPAPLAHLTGVNVGITVPFSAGAAVVLMDVWRPEPAVEMIERERCCISSGTPTFLEEIVSIYERSGRDDAALRQYSVGGAAVPPELIERAEAVGIGAFRCYGMTEHMSTTIANRSLPLAVRAGTDGPVGPGSEISCVDEDGTPLPAGEPGEIRVRGPERMMGYVDPAHNEGVLDAEEGWFSTGDVGFVDPAGNVHISGRTKDIINRGGEKFSAREIEDVVCAHPAVRQAAVVPAADPRYGEVPAAFIVLGEGTEAPSDEELAAFVQERRLARQKTPVRWLPIDRLPATPFGKVRKQELIDMLEERG